MAAVFFEHLLGVANVVADEPSGRHEPSHEFVKLPCVVGVSETKNPVRDRVVGGLLFNQPSKHGEIWTGYGRGGSAIWAEHVVVSRERRQLDFG